VLLEGASNGSAGVAELVAPPYICSRSLIGEWTMSDSGEDEASQLTTTSRDTELPAASTLSPEEAERFASAYVPAWQFDEALVSAGAQWSPGELEEFGAAPGADPDSILVDSLAPVVEARALSALVREEPASAKTDPQPLLRAEPARAASAPLPVGPIPMPSHLTSVDDVALSSMRSNRGAWFAAGGIVAALAVVAALLLTRGRESPSAASAALTVPASPPQTAEESRIPPPPPIAEIPPPPDNPVTPTRAAVSPPVPSPPARRASNAPLSHRSDATHTPRDAFPVTKGSAKGSGGTIVRDNPY
jgi:hypothetical protein